jgi:hypothetical protein
MIPIVIFRLPPESTAKTDPRLKMISYGHHQRELRLWVSPGCPSSLATHFAANAHRHGSCLYAWCSVAVVKDKGDRLIHAESSEVDGRSCLVFEVRGETLGNETRQLLQGAVDFVELELSMMRLPGLYFSAYLVCPDCSQGEFEWSEVANETVVSCRSCWKSTHIVNESSTRHGDEITFDRLDNDRSQNLLLQQLQWVIREDGERTRADIYEEGEKTRVSLAVKVEHIRLAVLALAKREHSFPALLYIMPVKLEGWKLHRWLNSPDNFFNHRLMVDLVCARTTCFVKYSGKECLEFTVPK